MPVLASGGLLAVFHLPWLLEAFLTSVFLRSSCVHVCLQISPFYKDPGRILILSP